MEGRGRAGGKQEFRERNTERLHGEEVVLSMPYMGEHVWLFYYDVAAVSVFLLSEKILRWSCGRKTG